MRYLPALLCFFVLPAGLMAQDTPDGLLGVDSVTVGVMYQEADYSYYDAPNHEYEGASISVNKNLYSNNELGIDAGIAYSYARNHDWRNVYHYHQDNYRIFSSIYREGMISPFLRVGVSLSDNTSKSPSHTSYVYSNQNTLLGGEIGAECHLLPGWWITPSLRQVVNVDSDSDDSSSYTVYGIQTGYWFAPRWGVSMDMFYTTIEHIDYTGAEVSVSYQF